MYDYTFVTVDVRPQVGRGPVTSRRAVIEQYATEGWRLVQVMVPELPAVPGTFELIFERSQRMPVGVREAVCATGAAG